MLLQTKEMKVGKFSIFCLVLANCFVQGEPAPPELVAPPNCAFVELPAMMISNEHKILKDAQLELIEKKDSFVPKFREKKLDHEDAASSAFGLVFLNKKKERGLPIELDKKKMLFEALNSLMKSEGITHWYIFQMRSTDQDLIGVYGPILYQSTISPPGRAEVPGSAPK